MCVCLLMSDKYCLTETEFDFLEAIFTLTGLKATPPKFSISCNLHTLGIILNISLTIN